MVSALPNGCDLYPGPFRTVLRRRALEEDILALTDRRAGFRLVTSVDEPEAVAYLELPGYQGSDSAKMSKSL